MRKKLVFTLTAIFIIAMSVTVNATVGSISAAATAETVIKGKTFSINISATSDTPIDGMYTNFSYDKNVLKLTSKAPASDYGDNSGEGEILVSNNTTGTSPKSAALYTLTFQVLDSAKDGETKITFSNSELHLNGSTLPYATNISDVVIKIKSDDTTVGNDNAINNTNNVNSNDNKVNTSTPSSSSNKTTANKNKSTGTSSSASANSSNKKLPQTGAEIISVVAIVTLGAVAITSYISYRKYKNI